MISLLNRFTAIGILRECRIDIFPSHIKAVFSLEIDKKTEITVHYFINKKFHLEKYNEFLEIIPLLHPEVNGYVWNGKNKIYNLFSNNLLEKNKEKLFISGNVLEKNGIIYFNAEFIKFTKLKNEFDFQFDGVVVNKNTILNIVNDTPRIFYIETNLNPSEEVFRFFAKYNSGYTIRTDNVYSSKQKNNFVLNNEYYTNKKISEKEIKDYLLEWEIINSNDK